MCRWMMYTLRLTLNGNSYVENLATGKQNEEKKKAEEMVGINIEVENYLSALKKQKSKTPDAPGPMIIGKDQMNVQENGKGRGNGKGKKSQNDKKSTKRAGKSKLNQNYIKSLLASNVYNEANANLGQRHRVDVPSEKNKDKVLKALIAGIPLNEQREARGQKSSLLRATKNLGPQGRCSPDGNGFWRLKGQCLLTVLRTILMYHRHDFVFTPSSNNWRILDARKRVGI